ncbi:hypothetical protein YC2023_051138 [Brassica napus]
MQPDIWEEWWRPACVLDMQPAMWSTRCRRACVRSHAKRHTGCHQPQSDWLSMVRYSTEKASSVQSTILYDCEAESLSKSIHPRQSDSSKVKWRYCPELVQFHGFRSVEVLLDTPPGSPKNCPEARGGSVRVQISLSRPVRFFMVKPRFCPSRVQSSPFKSSLGFWPSPLRSTSCFSPRTLEDRVAYRVECSRCCMVESLRLFIKPDSEIFGHIGRSPGCDVDTTGPMPYRLDYEYWLIFS